MEISKALKLEDKLIFGRGKLWLIEMRKTENEFYVKVEFDIEEETIQKNWFLRIRYFALLLN